MDLLPSFSTETWSLLVTFLGLFMLYGCWPYGIFKSLGIPGPSPLPFFGNVWSYRKSLMVFDTECFHKYGRTWGTYEGRKPILATLDPAIIKAVLVKECHTTFTNRRDLGSLGGLLESAVSMAKDEQWKRIRTVLSPTFTSGKLKEMFPIIKHYGEILKQNVQKRVEKGEFVVMKDVFGAYSMDVVTSTAFGVNIDSMNNPEDPFVKEIKKITKFPALDPRFVFIAVFPFVIPVLKLLKVNFFNAEAMNFFSRSFAKLKETRQKGGKKGRVDFLQLMIDSQSVNSDYQSNGLNHSFKGLTDTEILAQSFIFVFAGYEPTSNSLGYVAYLLATHPDVQQKLQDEIDTILPNKAPLTYDAIMKMEYLDMVLSETQRLYPLGGRLERVCKKDVEINGVTIPKDMMVVIPPYTLHRDPEYWPEPDEFRPESISDLIALVPHPPTIALAFVNATRFSKENKEQVDPYTYLPFGAGPRNCLGMRFALVTMKVAIAILVQHFSFRVCKETPIPLEMSKQAFLVPEKPIVLKLVPRGGPQ